MTGRRLRWHQRPLGLIVANGSFMKRLCLALVVGVLAANASVAQLLNPHASETIGTVQQVYDGTLLPDIQVNTFRNIDRLFPTRGPAREQHLSVAWQ